MSTIDPYSAEKTYKPGSSSHYAYLFVAEPAKSLIMVLHALQKELNQVLLINSDSAIARIKLAWWRTEIDRLFAGTPEHPITQSLSKFAEFSAFEKRHFYQMIDAVEMDLEQNRYMDWPEFESYCRLHSASLGTLIAQALGVREAAELEQVQELAIALQLIEHIRRIGEDARQGRIYFPINTLQEYNLRAADILNSKYSEVFTGFIQAQANAVRARLLTCIQSMPTSLRKQLRPCLIKAHLGLTLLKVLEQDKWQILDHRTSLTPIRKIFIASKIWLSGGRCLPKR